MNLYPKRLHQVCSSRQSAFTLVELLAGIAVIGILLLVLLPTINSVLSTSKDSTCISNLRQIGAAALLYSQEHENRTLPGNFYNALINEGYLPAQSYSDMIDKTGIWMCPHDTKDRSEVEEDKASSILNISYGYNAQRIGLPPEYWSVSKIMVNQIEDPANTIYLCDAKSYYFNRGNKNAVFRHSGDRLHAVFFDCHVEKLTKPEDLTEFYNKHL